MFCAFKAWDVFNFNFLRNVIFQQLRCCYFNIWPMSWLSLACDFCWKFRFSKTFLSTHLRWTNFNMFCNQNVPKMLTGADVSLLLLDKEKASLVAHTLMYYSVCVFKIPKKRDSRNFNWGEILKKKLKYELYAGCVCNLNIEYVDKKRKQHSRAINIPLLH